MSEDWPNIEQQKGFDWRLSMKEIDKKYGFSETEGEIEEAKTAKQWRRDEYVQQIMELLQRTRKKRQEHEKSMIEWRNKYFSLKAQTDKLLLTNEANDKPSVATDAAILTNDDTIK